MTREDAIKILSILKAAYPNSYRNMTKDEANGTISVWAAQFTKIPYEVVAIAINKLINTNTFPPSIHEVKEKIQGLYWEAWEMLRDHNGIVVREFNIWTESYEKKLIYQKKLDDQTLALVKEIIRVTEPMRTQERLEPSLGDLITGLNCFLTGDKSAELKLK